MGSRFDRWGPPSALAVAILSAAASVAAVGLIWWGSGRGVDAYDNHLGDIVVGLLFPAAGALVVRRQPRNAAGWVLVSAGLIGVTALAHQWAHHAAVAGRDSLPLVPLFTWLAAWTFAPYWLQSTLLPLLFPTGTLPSPRWRKLAIAVLVVVGVGTLAVAFRPDTDVEGLGLANPLGLGPSSMLPGFEAAMVLAAAGSSFVAAPLCIAALVLRQRRASGRERAQLQWLLLGFVAAALLLPLNVVGAPGTEVLFSLAFAAIPVTIVVAVLRHGLLDIEVVVNRAIVYGLLTALGLLGYVAMVALVSGRWVSEGEAAPAVAAAVAFAAALARERLQRFVDRRLFGSRGNPLAVIEQVGATVEAAVAPREALASLAAAVRRSLALPFVAIEPIAEGAPAASVGRPVAGVEELQVVAAGREVAVLRVGHRYRGERFRPEEASALADVARRAGTVIQAAALAADLQRSRERIVVAGEEERRRLRRDLHDGVGPALAGMALQLDGLATRLAAEPELAARADRLRGVLASTVADVRRIVDDLRPAPLDELGLAEALRQLAVAGERAPEVAVDVPAGLPALPAAVEAAAYRIAAEAVANAVRHSEAAHSRVRASVGGDWLEIEVTDDGRGFGADTVAGVGLESMHERAAEVGGQLEIRSRPGDGTRLRARLPMEVT